MSQHLPSRQTPQEVQERSGGDVQAVVLNTTALPVAKAQREPAKETVQSEISSPGQEAVDITALPSMVELCL